MAKGRDFHCLLPARRAAITRREAFAVVVDKLGFNPLSSKGSLLAILGYRDTRPSMASGCRIGREPCPLASRIKALVWHGECMAEGRVLRPSPGSYTEN